MPLSSPSRIPREQAGLGLRQIIADASGCAAPQFYQPGAQPVTIPARQPLHVCACQYAEHPLSRQVIGVGEGVNFRWQHERTAHAHIIAVAEGRLPPRPHPDSPPNRHPLAITQIGIHGKLELCGSAARRWLADDHAEQGDTTAPCQRRNGIALRPGAIAQGAQRQSQQRQA